MLRRSKTDAEDRQSAGPARLLVVADDDAALELVARLLEQATYAVERSSEHAEAVKMLRYGDATYSGVIVDFHGGGTSSSLKLLDAVRHLDDKARSQVPVMILTGTDTNRVFAWQSGADAFLVRPFHATEMVDEVHEMLERTDSEREQHRREQMKLARSAQARRVAE